MVPSRQGQVTCHGILYTTCGRRRFRCRKLRQHQSQVNQAGAQPSAHDELMTRISKIAMLKCICKLFTSIHRVTAVFQANCTHQSPASIRSKQYSISIIPLPMLLGDVLYRRRSGQCTGAPAYSSLGIHRLHQMLLRWLVRSSMLSLIVLTIFLCTRSREASTFRWALPFFGFISLSS